MNISNFIRGEKMISKGGWNKLLIYGKIWTHFLFLKIALFKEIK